MNCVYAVTNVDGTASASRAVTDSNALACRSYPISDRYRAIGRAVCAPATNRYVPAARIRGCVVTHHNVVAIGSAASRAVTDNRIVSSGREGRFRAENKV